VDVWRKEQGMEEQQGRSIVDAYWRKHMPQGMELELDRRGSNKGWRSSCSFSGGATGDEGCDRTTSKMKGLSPKIISGDSRRSENAQTHTNKHTIPNMKFKLKLLQIKCHVLGFKKKVKPKMRFKR
jgi:hypothetical protein